MIPPSAYLVHRTGERIRIRIPSKKGDSAYFASIQERLRQYEHVSKTVINPFTGSVLIYYTGDFSAIAEQMKKDKVFTLAKNRNNPGSLMDTTVNTYRNVDLRVRKLTNGELNLPEATCLALVGSGVYSMARRGFTAPSWHTAFWYALWIFLKRWETSKVKT